MAKNSCGATCGGCFGVFIVMAVAGTAASLSDALGTLILVATAIAVIYATITIAYARTSLQQWKRFVSEVKPNLAYVVLDLETSGLEPAYGAEIVQFAVMAFDENHTKLGTFSTLVKPANGVGATEIHGITPAAVRFARGFSSYARGMSELLDGTIVVAHNAPFDVGFLRSALVSPFWAHLGPRFRTIDTLALAREHLTTLSNYKLASCVDAVGLDLREAPGRGAHDALFDTWCCAGVLHAIVRDKQLNISDIAKWG